MYSIYILVVMKMHHPDHLLWWAQLCDNSSCCPSVSTTTFSLRPNVDKVLTQICSLKHGILWWASLAPRYSINLTENSWEPFSTWSYLPRLLSRWQTWIMAWSFSLPTLVPLTYLSYFPKCHSCFPNKSLVPLIPSWCLLLGGLSRMHAFTSSLITHQSSFHLFTLPQQA